MKNKLWKLVRWASPLGRDQRGITGLETAIVLIAFVVVSSVFAFAALSTGLFTTDKAKETIHAGLSQARGTMEMKSRVIATAKTTGNSGTVDTLTFHVSNAAAGEPIDMTVGNLIIRYADINQTVILDSVGDFTAEGIGNHNGDNLLERGEVFEIVVNIWDVLDALQGGVHLSTNQSFSLEVVPPRGAVLFIQRTTPVALNNITTLD
jgi:archaeal flagellin FlaB